MATTILGKVGLTPKGAWAEGTTYERLDVVSNGGSSYMSLSDNNTAALSDTSKWQVLVDATTSIDACNTAKSNAEAATTKAEAVNATLSDDYQFTVTDRNGTSKALSLASPASVSQSVADIERLKEGYVKVRCATDGYVWSDLEGNVFCPAGVTKTIKCKKKFSTTKNASFAYSQCEMVDLSHWDARWCTNAEHMFCGTTKISDLDVSWLDTSRMTYMCEMCQYLQNKELDVSHWDVSKVTNMYALFCACNSLTSLDLSGWDLTNVTNISGMLQSCRSLANIKFGPGWGKHTSTEANALTLDLSRDCSKNNNYQFSDETWSSMLTMHDRATAGLTAMTIKIKSTANIPDGWEDSMAALGYTITKV